MLEVGGGLDLGQEPLCPDHGRQLRLEDLERDLALMAEVVCEEDGGRPALADPAVDLIALFERRVQPVDHVRHVSSPCEGHGPMGVLRQVPTLVGAGARKLRPRIARPVLWTISLDNTRLLDRSPTC